MSEVKKIRTKIDISKYKKESTLFIHLFIHLFIFTGLMSFVMLSPEIHWAIYFLSIIVVGNSMLVMSFAAHEISHGGTGLRNGLLSKCLIHLGWIGGVFTTSTNQTVAHNRLHHIHTNKLNDPDRRVLQKEVSPYGNWAKIFSFFVPSHHYPKMTFLYGFAFLIFSYHNNLFWQTLFNSRQIYDLRLSAINKLKTSLEYFSNLLVYGGIWSLSGFSLKGLVFIALSYFVVAWMSGFYIITNHLNCSLLEDDMDNFENTLKTTVSLKIPKWIDFLHLHFSHHVEHHLFPGASHRLFPELREVLLKDFKDEYKILTWFEAIKLILERPIFLIDNDTLGDWNGKNLKRVAFVRS